MKKFSFLVYLFAMAIITIIFGVIYVTVQQSYRSGANDPQIQLARDINLKLHEGKAVDNFFTDSINIAQSLSPFAVLYDANGKPLRSSGYLNGKMPELPAGVFDYAKANGEHDVTWQPQSRVRMAMVIVIVSSNSSSVGFVAAGRSLQEVEIREHNLITMIFIGWIICIGLVLIYAVIQFYRHRINN
jgi:sensor histidine kinase regulating citrate/malate metabolism